MMVKIPSNVTAIRTTNQIQQLIRQRINEKVELNAIGNSKRKLRDLAIDLINASDLPWIDIATGTFLSVNTIRKLSLDITINPQSETIERIFRFFNYQVALTAVDISSKFANRQK